MSNNRTRLGVRKNYYLTAFLWGLALATLIFLPWILWNKGYFFFYGDFNVQQIPFYQMIHDEVRNGNIGWSYTTDLGANIIGSYSFYMIGSPFFWITLPFPSSFVPFHDSTSADTQDSVCVAGGLHFPQKICEKSVLRCHRCFALCIFGIWNI